MARSMPFFQLVPTVAPPPDSSATSASLIGAPDWAKATPVRLATSAKPVTMMRCIVLPLGWFPIPDPDRSAAGSYTPYEAAWRSAVTVSKRALSQVDEPHDSEPFPLHNYSFIAQT